MQKLETEYQAALLDVGLGYAKVEEELQSLKQKDQDFIHQREVAEVRGEHALKGKALKNYSGSKLVELCRSKNGEISFF